MKKFTLFMLLLCTSTCLLAQSIQAILFNPAGGDNGKEFVTLKGTANLSLDNIFLLEIEGEGNGAGKVDQVVSFAGETLGSNGIHLRRDVATVLLPAPPVATNVSIDNFTPDLENGTHTYLLVTNYTGANNEDIDSNNDGTLNASLPWDTVLDAISTTDGDAGDLVYAAQLGGTDLPDIPGEAAEFIFNEGGTWCAASTALDVNGTFTLTTVWDATGTTVPALAGSTIFPGGQSALPVLMEYFTAIATAKDAIQLDWMTSMEVNSDYFEIQYSSNRVDFEPLDKMLAAGNSTTKIQYSFTHEALQSGQHYYRLKQLDMDGAYVFSAIKAVEIEQKQALAIYPTITTGELAVLFKTLPTSTIQTSIYTLDGQQLMQQSHSATTTLQLNTATLNSAWYVLLLDYDGKREVFRFMKQ